MGRGPQKVRDAQGRMNQIYERMQERRKGLELTQDQLCGRIAAVTDGVWNPSRKDIGRCETGTRIISDIELLYLAKALECDPCWLFLGDRPDDDSGESHSPATSSDRSSVVVQESDRA
jgi:transcriptional regulator with XRE-family HTH domain